MELNKMINQEEGKKVVGAKKKVYFPLALVTILLIPFFAIEYVAYSNFFADREVTHFYDIGTGDYLSPDERVSGIITAGDLNYRNLSGHLVYFDVPIFRGANKISVKAKLKDNFPEGTGISIGARNMEEWGYLYKPVYDNRFDFGSYDNIGRVYRVNENVEVLSLDRLRGEKNIIVASDDFEPEESEVYDYKKTETVINSALRGGHEFYLYAEGYLEIDVKKQDLNWYAGGDDLKISLLDLDDQVIESMNFWGDGDVRDSKNLGDLQTGSLKVYGLKKGVYKLKFDDFDGLIREIRVNTNKIVTDRAFLAESHAYGLETKASRVYFESHQPRQLKVTTSHAAGIQSVFNNLNGDISVFSLNKEDKELYMGLGAGKTVLTFPKNDVTIESPEYFALSADSYFMPFKQKVVPLNSEEWLLGNVDYIVSDYVSPKREGDWLIVESEFFIEEDDLFVSADKLGLVFSIPHLSDGGINGNEIAVDWIEIKVHKSGVIQK